MSDESRQDMKLHHLGIVVRDVEVASKQYADLRGIDPNSFYYEYVESQKVNICLVKEGSSFIEFIEPVNDSSPVYSFLCSGGGLHHICYEVDNVQEHIAKLKPYARVIVKPVTGFENRTIAFLYVRSDDILGVSLIELAERKQKGK